jgi:hypothetical protein
MTYYMNPDFIISARYKNSFLHQKYLHAMTQLRNGLPASYIMDAVKGPLVIKLG